jgi:hypothetical protein
MAATLTNLSRTNTLSLAATTAYQLVSKTTGGCYFGILNLGPGNLYVRFDAAPTGATDTAALELPVSTALVEFLVTGSSGLYVLSDQAGKISVIVTSR